MEKINKSELIQSINDMLSDLSPVDVACLNKLTLSELVKIKQSIEKLIRAHQAHGSDLT